MQNVSAATNPSLYQIKGYDKFPLASSAGQAVTVAYSKESIGYIGGLSVVAGQEAFLHVEVPPGVTRSAKAMMHANAYDGIYTSIFKAAANQSALIPDNFSYDNFNNEPTSAAGNIDFYNGNVIAIGDATFGTLAIKNTRSSTFKIYTLQIVYVIGPTQTDLDNYNAWVKSKEGVVGSSPVSDVTSSPAPTAPPTAPTAPVSSPPANTSHFGDGSGDPKPVSANSTANIAVNSSDCPLAFLGFSCGSENISNSTGSLLEQTFTSGKNAVFEYIMILVYKNNGVDNISKLSGFKVSDNEFTLPGINGSLIKFEIDLNKIPESIDDIDKDSVNFSLEDVNGIDGTVNLIVQFKVSDQLIKLKLHPIVNQESRLIDLFKNIDGVFNVHGHNGWLFIIMDDGTSFSLFLTLDHHIARQKRNKLDFEEPVDYGYESNDVNGDGVDDILLSHNGKAQLMYYKANK